MLEELVELIGEEAAGRMVANFGGLRLYIPHFPGPDDALARAVGMRAAVALARVYGGERLEVPHPPPVRMRARAWQPGASGAGLQGWDPRRRGFILELKAAGRSSAEIARALGCTRRRVLQVLATERGTGVRPLFRRI